jgi:hypothetical protein
VYTGVVTSATMWNACDVSHEMTDVECRMLAVISASQSAAMDADSSGDVRLSTRPATRLSASDLDLAVAD